MHIIHIYLFIYLFIYTYTLQILSEIFHFSKTLLFILEFYVLYTHTHTHTHTHIFPSLINKQASKTTDYKEDY